MLFYFTQHFVLLLFVVRLCFAFDDFDILQDGYFMRKNNKKFILKQSFFNYLENYQVNALRVTEQKYTWIARVVHSRNSNFPHMCTAACIDNGIFITAARCIFNLKTKFTSVVYKSKRLPVRAFVLPSHPTRERFDDVGFLVIEGKPIPKYSYVQLFDKVNRTGEVFQWFADMDLSGDYKVVGYAIPKGLDKNRKPERLFHLTELYISVGFDLCSTILTANHHLENEGFNVPCYHSCTMKEFKKKANACNNYHGVEGGAVINAQSNKLFGLAIWGTYFPKYELPVGFSVLNSKSFYEDFACARKIRNSKIRPGYQNLCS